MSYTIFVLPETEMTIIGAELDGVSQGSGIHMVGARIILNSKNWVPIEINDPDEDGDSDYGTIPPGADFRDNDSNQTIENGITIDNQTFGVGARVEAEYSLTATFGGQTFSLVALNIVGGPGSSYGTIEGLAFIGPEGGFPPVGEELLVTAAQEGPNFNVSEYATPICFVAGTRVAVPGGNRAVETLRPGDLVETAQSGPQPVRWVGRRTVRAVGRFAPVEFRPGVMGNTDVLRVSRQHRVHYAGWKAEMFFGNDEVLIPAVHFVDGTGVVIAEGGWVTYVHILFDDHQIVFAEGVASESLHPSARNLHGISRAAREELFDLFPELKHAPAAYGPVAHPSLTAVEAYALLHI